MKFKLLKNNLKLYFYKFQNKSSNVLDLERQNNLVLSYWNYNGQIIKYCIR